jgi:hypothetical protein
VSGQDRHGLGDPRIAWTVLLTATLREAPSAALISARLDELAGAENWSSSPPLAITVNGDEVTLAADHRYLDGQAMLAALSRLLDRPVRSLATGVGSERRRAGLGLGGAKRLFEVSARPSAVLAPTSTGDSDEDAIAHAHLPYRVSTSDLVVAATDALAGGSPRPISVAVGVATRVGSELADNSGYLRIRDARGLSRAEVSDFLRRAPLQPGGEPAGAVGALASIATRALANRLGSTVLVSHLGDVVADGVADLAFYPVSGGASGLSLGAATIEGRTTITLRARGHRHSSDGLERLLETITAALG